MMKISKPALVKDFVLSSVQFTSLNSIVFKNVKNVYEGNEKITLEYEHSPKIEASSRDWIGIFPHGWSTLQQYITFEWVSQSFSMGSSEQNKENGDLVRRAVIFCPKYHMGSVNSNSYYQFVYISKQIEVLGVSSYFRFDLTHANNRSLELECLVPVSSKIRSTSVSDFGILLGNNLPSSTSIDTRTLQTSSIHSLQNLDGKSKNWAKPSNSLNAGDVIKPAIFPRKTTGTGDALDPYTSHSEPVFPMSFQMAHCKKCVHFKRGGEFLRSQQVLQSKVGPRSEGSPEFGGLRRSLGHKLHENKLKIVMERNKVLEERSQEMKKEMERLQAESKKLKLSYYNTNKEKVAYEKFVKDFLKSLEKDSIVRVVNGNTEILVKKVNYVGMEEHPRGKKTSKRERELKAVIGLQEITIRNLINSLQEKAKSVKELNQTVKLAQAFSAARGDTREYGSDAEEALDEVSNSDVTSEYEFSLSKPQPPEEAVVEDTDAVLDDIRRTTEMELKDIGINRSLGKSSSRDSELELTNLSVRSYHNQSEGTRPKKPRLFDNLEDCWPFTENAPKTIHRKVLESSRAQEGKDGRESPVVSNYPEGVHQEESGKSEAEILSAPAAQTNSEDHEKTGNTEDSAIYEDYYDAYEDSETSLENDPEVTEEMTVVQEPTDENPTERSRESSPESQEKKNFLVTAIIPQEMSLEPAKQEENWSKTPKQEEAIEKKTVESPIKKGKKITCELSIDFSAKRGITEGNTEEGQTMAAVEYKQPNDQVQNQICQQFDVGRFEDEFQQEKPIVTFKKANKCLEIKITQVDQKDGANVSKNYVHQTMVVKFAKETPTPTSGSGKPSKFEFNVALTGLGEGSKEVKPERPDSPGRPLELSSREENLEVEASPRTEWNDATDDMAEDEPFPPEPSPREEVEPVPVNDEEAVERESNASDEPKDDPPKTPTSATSKTNEDSLRYEKNLEFLQQKTNDRIKGEEDAAKDKPSAILIQNGQTKLALIRYQ